MKVLITGGTGFIGSQLAYRCLERGDKVVVYGQVNTEAEKYNHDKLRLAGAQIVLGSVTDRKALWEALDGVQVLFHLAAAQHEMNVPDEHFYNVNVRGTQTVLEVASERSVSCVLHGSTIGVYGALEGTITEKSPCRPDNIYGVTKLEGEKTALSFAPKIPVVVIRIPEVYGPGDRRLLKLFKAVSKGRFLLPGGGGNLHHPIFVQDLISGFFAALDKPEARGEVFLLAGPRPITTEEMVCCTADSLGVKLSIYRVPLRPFWLAAWIMEKTLRPLGVQPPLHRRRMDFFRKSFKLSSDKARRVLGFSPQVDFPEGARLTAEWYKQEGLL